MCQVVAVEQGVVRGSKGGEDLCKGFEFGTAVWWPFQKAWFGTLDLTQTEGQDGYQIKLLNNKGHVWVHALGRLLQQPVCGGNMEVREAQNRETGLEAMAVVQ